MSDTSRILIGIPVYNEAASVPDVIEAVRGYGLRRARGGRWIHG